MKRKITVRNIKITVGTTSKQGILIHHVNLYHCSLLINQRSGFHCDMRHITLIKTWLDIACSDAPDWYKLDYITVVLF